MKVAPRQNVQQSQNTTIVNKIRAMFFNGKVKLRTLLCDVFEKKSIEPKKPVQDEGNEWLKDLIPADAYDPNKKVEYKPPWLDMEGAIVKTRCYYPEDQNVLDSLKTKEERSEFIEKLIKEKRYFYKD